MSGQFGAACLGLGGLGSCLAPQIGLAFQQLGDLLAVLFQSRSDAVVGQWVLAGEPVGVMGSSQNGDPKLYVELRRDGHPIDPEPWLGKSDSKVE